MIRIQKKERQRTKRIPFLVIRRIKIRVIAMVTRETVIIVIRRVKPIEMVVKAPQ